MVKDGVLRLGKRFGFNLESNSKVQNYWRNPPVVNQPDRYLNHSERSKFLTGIVKDLVPLEARILEIGCNVGRNLHYLWQAGYHNLKGIEINAKAIDLLRETYPELNNCPIYCGPAEDILPTIGNFDLVFTMAVLMHIKNKSIFSEIARIADNLITIEQEEGGNWGHFNRNYGKTFTRLGMKEVEQKEVQGMGDDYVARAFARRS